MQGKLAARQQQFVLREWTLGKVLDTTIARDPDGDALVCPGTDMRKSWREFGAAVDELARGLMAMGVAKGEKVAVWATNVPYWVILQFATAKIGAVLVTVNTNYHASELEFLLRQSESENLFVIASYRDHDFLRILREVLPELGTAPAEGFSCPRLPHLKRIVLLGGERQPGMFTLADVLARAPETNAADYQSRQASLDPWDVINMQYTSGTTGFPKGVMLTHVGVGLNGYWIGAHQHFSGKDRVCLPVPLFHCYGCVLGTSACVNHGATMVILESFNPLHVLEAVHNERCTAVYGVPTMYLAVMEHKAFARYDLTSLRTGIMAGSVCPEPLMRRVVNDMHMREITICYGLTEASPVMTQSDVNDPIEVRCSTVGCAMPGIEVIIANPDTCEELPHGQVGEILCRGYNVMKGYYRQPEATRVVISPEGWLHSGDLGVMDDEGYIRVTGRIKDMIIRGGENIYPREIEEFLLGMEQVSDVQIVAVPSRKYGEDLGCFIIAKPGCTVTGQDVRDFCRGRIAWHKVPRHIAVVDAYPLTASGKIQKYRLREMAAERWGNED